MLPSTDAFLVAKAISTAAIVSDNRVTPAIGVGWSSDEFALMGADFKTRGKRTDEMPMTQSDIARAEPVYEELPGWWEDISGARTFDELPAKARDYVLRLEELAGAQVSCIGAGIEPPQLDAELFGGREPLHEDGMQR